MTTLVGRLAAQRAEELVGSPFAHCGRGPVAYDCVGLALESYKFAGVDLPDFRGYSRQTVLNDPAAMVNPILEHFRKVDEIQIGDLLLFAIKGHLTHVAIALGADAFVHAYEGSINKAVRENMTEDWRKRLQGAYRLK